MIGLTLFVTGMGMGIVHVLTGPDHLSALATLSANIGNFEAFWYGVRWGIGHSIGLLVVGSIFIGLDFSSQGGNGNGNDDDTTITVPDVVQSFCESIVGVFMIFLGIYGLISCYQKYKRMERGNQSDGMVDDYDEGEGGSEHLSSTELSPSTDDGQQTSFLPSLDVQQGEASMSMADVSYDAMGTTIPQMNKSNTPDFIHDHHHHHHHECCGEDEQCCCSCCGDFKVSKPILSLGIGIIHGVAGPGGVLGVIPAVELHNWKLAIIYLGTFCLSSTLTMGTFAALYGSCSSYVSQRDSATMGYRMEMFSSGLSVFVGVLWLFLLSIGKLDDIFP